MREILETIDNAQVKALGDAAAEHFGITHNPLEAGYLLPDGRLLDLSGRHAMIGGDFDRAANGTNIPRRGGRDWQANVRQTDHRELDFFDGMGGTDGMLRFMEQSGAIRINPTIGFTLRTMPTKRQMAVMCACAKMFDEKVFVEVYDGHGDVTSTQEFLRLTPAALIKFLQNAEF